MLFDLFLKGITWTVGFRLRYFNQYHYVFPGVLVGSSEK